MGSVTLTTDTVMYEHPATASTTTPGSWGEIDEVLRKRIDTAVGGSARFRRVLMLEGRALERPVMVVVVERPGLPDDEVLRRRFRLTPRESEVARLMADRLSNAEIGRRLGITVNTARTHGERVLRKLGIHTRNHVRTALLAPEHAPGRRHVRGVA
jgi:DNA-binding CsgD family transcriptional regulator